MRRIRCACLLAFLILALSVLSGCHGSRGMDPFAVPETFDTSRSYEITFWAKNDTNKTQTQIYEDAIREFEALYPNIHVNKRLYTDYGKIYNMLSPISRPIRRPMSASPIRITSRRI